jgi:hypothetical protein
LLDNKPHVEGNPLFLGKTFAVATLVDYVKDNATGFDASEADYLVIERLARRGIKELDLNIRKADKDHVIRRVVTCVTYVSRDELEELRMRKCREQ